MIRAPDVLLDRYLAGDLTPAARRNLEARLAASPELRERLSHLRTEREVFLADEPPERFAQRIAARVYRDERSARRRPRLFGLLLAPATAVAAAAVAVVLAVRSEEHLAPAVETPPPIQLTEASPEQVVAAPPEEQRAARSVRRSAGVSPIRPSAKAGEPAPVPESLGAADSGSQPVASSPAHERKTDVPSAARERQMLASGAAVPGGASPAAPSSSPAARAASSVREPHPERSPLVAALEVRGDLEPSAVASVIESRRPEILRAWQQAHTSGTPSPATLELLLTITASGDVERTELVVPAAGATALERALHRRIAAAARAWRFPPSPSRGATVVRCTFAQPQ